MIFRWFTQDKPQWCVGPEACASQIQNVSRGGKSKCACGSFFHFKNLFNVKKNMLNKILFIADFLNEGIAHQKTQFFLLPCSAQSISRLFSFSNPWQITTTKQTHSFSKWGDHAHDRVGYKQQYPPPQLRFTSYLVSFAHSHLWVNAHFFLYGDLKRKRLLRETVQDKVCDQDYVENSVLRTRIENTSVSTLEAEVSVHAGPVNASLINVTNTEHLCEKLGKFYCPLKKLLHVLSVTESSLIISH